MPTPKKQPPEFVLPDDAPHDPDAPDPEPPSAYERPPLHQSHGPAAHGRDLDDDRDP